MKQELLNELITSLGLEIKHVGEEIITQKYEGLAVKIRDLKQLTDTLDSAMNMRRLGQ